MALMTGEQYIESIRKIPMEIYMFGKKVENPVDDPILRPSLNSVRMTYDLAQMPEYQDLMTVVSPETGERINRFTHIHRSTEDLRNKVKMQRLSLIHIYHGHPKALGNDFEIDHIQQRLIAVDAEYIFHSAEGAPCHKADVDDKEHGNGNKKNHP